MIETISRTGYAFLRYLATRLLRIDLMLLALVVTLTTIGFIALFSAGYSFPWRIEGQIRNIAVAGVVMLVVSCIPVKAFQKATVPIFIVGCVLLLLTHFFGVTVKGATRWLNVGVRIQPSELMKLAVPMMLAWYYNVRGENVCNWDHLTAFIIMAVPVGLIVKQPDLGTSILVLIAGASVIFFAGLSKRILVSLTGILILSMPVIWSLMHDYQRQRVLTLLDPSADPLGKGFHILQALIAIGSGGFSGKGWMEAKVLGWKARRPISTSFPNARATSSSPFSARNSALSATSSCLRSTLRSSAAASTLRPSPKRASPASLRAPSAASSSRTPSSTWAWSVVSCPWWACRCPS